MKRSYLGTKLRESRKLAGISGPEVANRIGVNQSTISRLESGKLRPDSDTVYRYVRALQLDADRTNELLAAAQAFLFEYDRWRVEEPGQLLELQAVARRFEEQAKEILGFTDDIVPGNLQIPEYIDRLFTALGEKDAAQRRKAIKARLKRRRLLERGGKRFDFVLNESAFNNPVIPDRIMAQQVEALFPWFDSGRPVQLYLLPFRAKLTQFPMNGFYIHDRRFVFVETHTRGISIWDDSEVQSYCRLFEALRVASITGQEAKVFLSRYVSKRR